MWPWRRKTTSEDEAQDAVLAGVRRYLPPGCAREVFAAVGCLRTLHAKADEGALCSADAKDLRKGLGTLKAAVVVIDAEARRATWWTDTPRLECVFSLEALYYEGEALRDAAPSDECREEINAKLLCLRDIINEIKAGAPIRDSDQLPTL